MSDSVDMANQLDGELVTYVPYVGVPRRFKAIVKRRPTQVEQAGHFQYGANTIELLIPRDATNGVLTVQTRKDTVTFKKNLSDTQETTFTVNTIMQEDTWMGGMFHVLVQA